jgi:hypothetical protein
LPRRFLILFLFSPIPNANKTPYQPVQTQQKENKQAQKESSSPPKDYYIGEYFYEFFHFFDSTKRAEKCHFVGFFDVFLEKYITM